MGKLNNKTAIITGGSTGIGLATAQTFIQEGAKVVITGRTQETLDEAVATINSKNLVAIQSDTSKLEDIQSLASKVKSDYGKVDILFANAGIAWFAPLAMSDENFFDAQFNTNVKGLFFTVQMLEPLFNEGGSIILNASAVTQMGMENATVYSATKAAVRSFARTLATELAPRNIRVNAVSPGPIETPIFSKLGMTEEEMKGMSEQFSQIVALKRFGRSEEVAKAVRFLASDDSSYVTGDELFVDGGIATTH